MEHALTYESLRAFKKHLEESLSSGFAPMYLVLSKDSFQCREAVELLLRALLPSQGTKECAREASPLSVFDGSEVDEKKLEETLYSGSLFVKVRVIWIQQVEKLRKSVQDNLEKYFIDPEPCQYLLLSGASWQKKTSFYQSIEKRGVILDCTELKPWEKEKHLVEWVSHQAMAARKLISYQVCQLLVRRMGNDHGTLLQEFEKLMCYCGDRQEITSRDVEAICSQNAVDSAWQLGEAIFRRDRVAALQIVSGLFTERHSLLSLLRHIRSQFQTEFQVALLLAQGREQEVSQEFPYMKGQILHRHIQIARQYGLDAFKRGLLALNTTELRLKNSSSDERTLIELLIMQLTHA